MALTIAVPDIHGRLDLLLAMLGRIEAVAPTGRVVFLGDYVDRGPQSAGVIDRLIAGPPAGWDWVLLMGNHEAMMRDAPADAAARELWLRNGGDATLASYGGPAGRDIAAVPPAHLGFLRTLRLWATDRYRVYVHAYVDPNVPLERQDERDLLWTRYGERDTGHGDRHVVHGHTPFPTGPKLYRERTNLDTGAVFTGRLVAGIFDDQRPGGPVDVLEVRG